jgi:hypothetical protein
VLIAFPYFFNRYYLYIAIELKKYPVVGDPQSVGVSVVYQPLDVGRCRKRSQAFDAIPNPELCCLLKLEQLSCGFDGPLDAIHGEI